MRSQILHKKSPTPPLSHLRPTQRRLELSCCPHLVQQPSATDQVETREHKEAEEQPQPIRGRPAHNIIDKICCTGTCNLNRYWRGKKK